MLDALCGSSPTEPKQVTKAMPAMFLLVEGDRGLHQTLTQRRLPRGLWTLPILIPTL